MCYQSSYLTGSVFVDKNKRLACVRKFVDKICRQIVITLSLQRIHHKSRIAHVAVTKNTHRLNKHTMTERFMKESGKEQQKKKQEKTNKNNGDPRTWTPCNHVTASDLPSLQNSALTTELSVPLDESFSHLKLESDSFAAKLISTSCMMTSVFYQCISRWVDHYSTVLWRYCACVCSCMEKKSFIACNTVFGQLLGVFPWSDHLIWTW